MRWGRQSPDLVCRERMRNSISTLLHGRGGSRHGWLALILPLVILAGCSLTTGSTSTATGTSSACDGGRPSANASGDLGTPNTSGSLVGPVSGDQQIHLTVALNLNQQALDTCLQSIYDPNSPNYQHYLSPSDIAQRFAPSASDIAKIKTYLTSQGLTVSEDYATGAALAVDGPASAVNKAFNVTLSNYQSGAGQFFSPDKTPSLPSDVQSLVTNVAGLSSNVPVSCYAGKCTYIKPMNTLHLPPNFQPVKHQTNTVSGDCLLDQVGLPIPGSPTSGTLLLWSDLKSAYGLDTLAQAGFDGSGTTIGMLEFDSYSRQDVVNYMLCAGNYAPNRLTNIDVVPGLDHTQAGAGEATLDVELALGMTSATTNVVTYNAPNDAQWEASFQAILQRVASDKKVSVLSISYGDFEQDLTPTYREAINQSMKLLAAEGISVFVASGDCGAYGAGTYGAKVVDFPASAPYAIAVGGTHLATDPLAHTRTGETVWTNTSPDTTTCANTWGSGGGVSGEPSFTIPSWQRGTGVSNQFSTGARQVPDVSAAAINISIYYSGLWLGTGGTSAAAPIWATGIDIVNQALAAKKKSTFGGVPTVYQLANSAGYSQDFTDITQGGGLPQSATYGATTGWDFATGWGSPHFDQIAASLGG